MAPPVVGDARESAQLLELFDETAGVLLDVRVDRAGGDHTAILTLGM
jgi:hypothetical protein